MLNESKVQTKMPTPSKNRVIPPLATETRSTVETPVAAYHLNRKEQTLRYWACYGLGPIQPVRVHGRLHWRISDIRRLLGGNGDE